MSRFKELIHDSKLMSGIYSITLITALLILALVIKGPEESGKLVADRNGSIVGINRRSLDRSERYDLSINVEDGDTSLTRDVTLTLQASANGQTAAVTGRTESREAEIDAAIDNMISSIEYSREKKIKLPSALPDLSRMRLHFCSSHIRHLWYRRHRSVSARHSSSGTADCRTLAYLS